MSLDSFSEMRDTRLIVIAKNVKPSVRGELEIIVRQARPLVPTGSRCCLLSPVPCPPGNFECWIMNAERALASLEKFGAALTGMAEGNFE